MLGIRFARDTDCFDCGSTDLTLHFKLPWRDGRGFISVTLPQFDFYAGREKPLPESAASLWSSNYIAWTEEANKEFDGLMNSVSHDYEREVNEAGEVVRVRMLHPKQQNCLVCGEPVDPKPDANGIPTMPGVIHLRCLGLEGAAAPGHRPGVVSDPSVPSGGNDGA